MYHVVLGGQLQIHVARIYRKKNVTKLVIHHCASSNTTVTNSTPQVHQKYIQGVHKKQNWCDIGYHFGIGKDGTILEGMPIGKEGIHVGNHNHYTLGVVVHGNYKEREFTAPQKNALCNLLAWLCYDYGLAASSITYHQALAATACPGVNIISQVSSIRSTVHNILNNGPIS